MYSVPISSSFVSRSNVLQQRKRTIRSICRAAIVSVVLLAASGCLGKQLNLPTKLRLPEVPAVNAEQTVPGGNVSIDEVIDARQDRAIAIHEGSPIEPAADIAGVVRQALEKSLTSTGLYVSDTAPVVLTAEVREWKADIAGKSSPRADATAVLFLKVFDPANKMIYSGSYKGNANLQKVNMVEDDVREVLAQALTESISQVTRDTQLLKLLASF